MPLDLSLNRVKEKYSKDVYKNAQTTAPPAAHSSSTLHYVLD